MRRKLNSAKSAEMLQTNTAVAIVVLALALVAMPAGLRSNRRKPARWHRGHYRKRHKVENLFQRLKRHRRIGTRYEKNDSYFLGFVHLAAILDWLKKQF